MPPTPSLPLHLLQTEILEALVLGERFETIARSLCQRAEELAPDAICSILEIANGVIRPIAAPSLPPDFSEAIDGVAIGPNAGSCGTAAYLGEPVEVDDISTSLLWADYKDLALSLDALSVHDAADPVSFPRARIDHCAAVSGAAPETPRIAFRA